MSESSGLLLPQRLDGAYGQLQQAVVYALLLLSVSVIIVCIAYGISFHAEHLIMGVALALATAQFYQLLRLYTKDILQDRKIVVFAAAVLLMLNIAALCYAVEFGSTGTSAVAKCAKNGDGLTSVGYYSPKPFATSSEGQCLTFSGVGPGRYSCSAIMMTSSSTNPAMMLAIRPESRISDIASFLYDRCRAYSSNGTRSGVPDDWFCSSTCSPCLQRKR